MTTQCACEYARTRSYARHERRAAIAAGVSSALLAHDYSPLCTSTHTLTAATRHKTSTGTTLKHSRALRQRRRPVQAARCSRRRSPPRRRRRPNAPGYRKIVISSSRFPVPPTCRSARVTSAADGANCSARPAAQLSSARTAPSLIDASAVSLQHAQQVTLCTPTRYTALTCPALSRVARVHRAPRPRARSEADASARLRTASNTNTRMHIPLLYRTTTNSGARIVAAHTARSAGARVAIATNRRTVHQACDRRSQRTSQISPAVLSDIDG
jgi:hypothetical protein